MSLQSGNFNLKRYSGQVWKLLIFLTFNFLLFSFWLVLNCRSCKTSNQWVGKHLPILDLSFLSPILDLAWMLMFKMRDGCLAPDFWGWEAGSVAKRPNRILPPFFLPYFQTKQIHLYPLVPTGFGVRILFEEQMLKLRKHLTTTGLDPFWLWHCDALRSDDWLLTCPSLLHKVPSWTQWQVLSYGRGTSGPEEMEASLNPHWHLREAQSSLIFRF